MTPISYAVSRIKREIPPQILNKFFIPKKQYQLRRDAFMPANIDNMIIQKVINEIVRPDCDIAGATEITIPLMGLKPEMVDIDKYIIHIPKQLTNGREITSALGIALYGVNNLSTSAYMQGAGIGVPMATSTGMINGCNNGSLNPIMQLGASMQPMLAPETTNVEVIDGSTILVSDMIYPNQNAYLRCIVSHDKEFSSLSQPAWKHFGTLCVYACKAYIYNNYIIDIDMAELSGGLELGRFKEIVESYSEANDLYHEFYNDKWRKIQFMSDETRHTRYLKSLIGRYK